jgi:hypothetical protein
MQGRGGSVVLTPGWSETRRRAAGVEEEKGAGRWRLMAKRS